jgi:hypothetical protein
MTDARMIGSALAIAPNPEHAAMVAKHNEHRAALEPKGYRDGATHVILGGRQEGKTRLAMEWLLGAPVGVERVLVVMNAAMAENLKAEHGLAKNDRRIVGYRQITGRGVRRRGVEYGIDESVQILAQLLGIDGVPVLLTVATAATWQVEPEPEPFAPLTDEEREHIRARRRSSWTDEPSPTLTFTHRAPSPAVLAEFFGTAVPDAR